VLHYNRLVRPFIVD